MSDTFDPYYIWLGIPPKDQPPNHYRLLGIDAFEANPDVIANAADQRMTHIRSLQIGRYGDLSQTILNEISCARLCLLNPGKKTLYDQQLRASLALLDRGPAVLVALPTVPGCSPAIVAGIEHRPPMPGPTKLDKETAKSSDARYIVRAVVVPEHDGRSLHVTRPEVVRAVMVAQDEEIQRTAVDHGQRVADGNCRNRAILRAVAKFLVAAPSKLDGLLARLVGKENTILRNFLRIAASLTLVITVAVGFSLLPSVIAIWNRTSPPAQESTPEKPTAGVTATPGNAARPEAADVKEPPAQAERDLAEEAKARHDSDESAGARLPGAQPGVQREAPEGEDSLKWARRQLARWQREEAEAQANVDRQTGWRERALRFVGERPGIFLEDRPLVDGKLPILHVFDEPGGNAPQLFLGAGRLSIDDGVYAFGDGFEQRAPVTKHEVPKAAKDLGYASVSIELNRRADGFQLIARAQSVDLTAEAKAEMERLKGARQVLMSQLTRWRESEKMPDSPGKELLQKEMRNMLVRMAGIAIPGVPAAPDPRDPRFVNKPDAYRQAAAQFNAAATAHNDAIDRIPETARQRLTEMAVRIDELAAKIRRVQVEARREEARGQERWNARCRTITVIVYRDAPVAAKPEAGGKVSPMATPGKGGTGQW